MEHRNISLEELAYRQSRITQLLHIVFSQMELSRGYGGDLPPSPYISILDELEEWMTQDGIPSPPKPGQRPKILIAELP